MPVGRSVGGGARAEGLGVRDGPGCLAEEQAQVVFGLLDLLLELWDLGGGGVEELLGLANVRERSGAAGFELLGERERVLTGFEGVLCDGELGVERAELEIGGGDLLDEGDAHGTLCPLLREELIALGFGLMAVEAPEVGRPGGGKAELDRWAGENGGSGGGEVGAGAAEGSVDLRELLRAGDADLLLLLEDVLGGNAEVVIVGERGVDEVLELRLVEDGGPLLVCGDGGGGVGGDGGVVGAAEGGRRGGLAGACIWGRRCSR